MSLIIDTDDIPGDDTLWFQSKEPKEALALDEKDGRIVDGIDIEGTFSRVGREIFFSGAVKTELELECNRCLEPFLQEIRAEVSVSYIPYTESDDPDEKDQELRESDIEVEFYRESKLDLAQPVYDQILLNLPFTRLCRSDCQGLCPQCGANKNVEDCGCQVEGSVDPRLAVLENLKNKLK